MNQDQANQLLKTNLLTLTFPLGIVEICKCQIDNEPRFVIIYDI